MNRTITQKELEEIKGIKGEVRGIGLKDIMKFILKEEGEEGLKRMEELISNIGYPLKYEEIKAMDFYPLVLVAVFFLAIEKLFDYSDEKLQEVGRFASKSFSILRLFIRYLVSIDTVVKETQTMWGKYFTVGELKVKEHNEKQRYIIVTLKNFRSYPPHCQYLKGYFSNIVEMVVKEPVTCEEQKCVYRGDEYHEFLLKW